MSKYTTNFQKTEYDMHRNVLGSNKTQLISEIKFIISYHETESELELRLFRMLLTHSVDPHDIVSNHHRD